MRYVVSLLISLAILLCTLAPLNVIADEVRILPLQHGNQAGQIRLDLIRKAQHSITAEYFIFDADGASLVGLALLREAARRGVKVRLIIDYIANSIPGTLLLELRNAGVEIKEYHPIRLTKPGWIFRRLHDKVLIVDRTEMVTGGRNVQNSYFSLPSHNQFIDRDIYVVGSPVVEAAADYFDNMWKSREVRYAALGSFNPRSFGVSCNQHDYKDRQICNKRQALLRTKYQKDVTKMETRYSEFLRGETEFDPTSEQDWAALTDPVSNAIFIHDPIGAKSDKAGTGPLIVQLIDSAKETILIETAYLVPHKDVIAALKRAVERGVDIQIQTNSAYSDDEIMVMVSYYRDEQRNLLDLGVRIWEYKGSETVHGKSYIIDGRKAFIGSFNLDRISHKYNTEVGVLFEDPEVIHSIIEDIRSRQSQSWEIGFDGRPVNLQPNESYPWSKKGRFTRQILEILLPLYRWYL